MSTNAAAAAPNRVIHRDVVCPFCAGACDDLQITVEDQRHVVAIEGGCEDARRRFAAATEMEPMVQIEQQPATLDEAIEHAAEILNNARAPLIFGLDHLTCEAQSLAVSLADRLGATIDSASSLGMTTRGTSMQQVGESTCTLGELRERADFVLFWGAINACQLFDLRLRHSTAAPPASPAVVRTVVEVEEGADGKATGEAAGRAGRRFRLRDAGGFEAACVLRALVRELPLDSKSVLAQTGVAPDEWRWLAEQMKSSKYGVIVGAPADRNVERALNQLVIELNDHTRFAYLNVRAAGMNGVGAEQVLTWRSGFPGAVNFAAGYPRFGPREHSTEEVLERREADAVLAFGSPTFSDGTINSAPLRLPRIVLANSMREDDQLPTVFIRTAQPGLHTGGTIYRFDGIPLPLRGIVSSSLPTTEHLLTLLCRRQRRLVE